MRGGILCGVLQRGTWEPRSPATKSSKRVAKSYKTLNDAGVTCVVRRRFRSYRRMICTVCRVDNATEPRGGPDVPEALVTKGWRTKKRSTSGSNAYRTTALASIRAKIEDFCRRIRHGMEPRYVVRQW